MGADTYASPAASTSIPQHMPPQVPLLPEGGNMFGTPNLFGAMPNLMSNLFGNTAGVSPPYSQGMQSSLPPSMGSNIPAAPWPGSTAGSGAPMASLGIDINLNGRTDLVVSGPDVNRDGIPDILQQGPACSSGPPYAGPSAAAPGLPNAPMYMPGSVPYAGTAPYATATPMAGRIAAMGSMPSMPFGGYAMNGTAYGVGPRQY